MCKNAIWGHFQGPKVFGFLRGREGGRLTSWLQATRRNKFRNFQRILATTWVRKKHIRNPLAFHTTCRRGVRNPPSLPGTQKFSPVFCTGGPDWSVLSISNAAQIWDPMDRINNVAYSCRRVEQIQLVFGVAVDSLAWYSPQRCASVLGSGSRSGLVWLHSLLAPYDPAPVIFIIFERCLPRSHKWNENLLMAWLLGSHHQAHILGNNCSPPTLVQWTSPPPGQGGRVLWLKLPSYALAKQTFGMYC